MRPVFMEIINIKEVILLLPVIKNLADMFPLLIGEGIAEDKAFTGKLFKRIIDIWEEFKKLSWKFLIEFIKVIPSLQRFFKEQKYFEYFIEELTSIIKSGNFQLKYEASYSFCKLVRQNEIYKKREKYVIDMFGLKTSASYYERVGFLEFCKALIDCYSFLFLQNHDVVTKMLTLANDKISNMRLRVIKVCIEASNKLQEDLQRVILKKVEEMCSDVNKDVKSLAEKAVVNIKKTIDNKEQQVEIARANLIKEQEENFLLEKVMSGVYANRNKKKK